jgi:hypothetical protein
MLRGTVMYLILSLLLAACGAALLGISDSGRLAPGEEMTVYDPVLLSIATSLIAAGLASLVFTVIREIDQRDAAQSNQRLKRLIELEQELREGLTELRRTLLLTQNPDARRIYKVHPREEVREEISNAGDRRVRLDALGLALKSLYDEQVRPLIDRGDSEVRLLVEDPRSEAFAAMCDQESRDHAVMMRDILDVTDYVQEWAERQNGTDRQGVSLMMKWSTLNAPVTMTRVNDWMVVRTRFPREGTRERGFFEQYTPDDGRAFDQLERFFEESWSDAEEPTAEDVEAAREQLDKLLAARRQGP